MPYSNHQNINNNSINNNSLDNSIIEQYTKLADDIGDLLFELEQSYILTELQTKLISLKLDEIFKNHIEAKLK